MLRITKMAESPSIVTLKLEGRIASEWVPLLEGECLKCLKEQRKVLLDFSDVSFVDENGVKMLGRLAVKNVEIIDHSALIKESLKGGEKK